MQDRVGGNDAVRVGQARIAWRVVMSVGSADSMSPLSLPGAVQASHVAAHGSGFVTWKFRGDGIHLFDSTAKLVGTVGGARARDPVEFGVIRDLAVNGDTIIVLDSPEDGPDRASILLTAHFKSLSAPLPVFRQLNDVPPGFLAWHVLRAGDQWILGTSRMSTLVSDSGSHIQEFEQQYLAFDPSRGDVGRALLVRSYSRPVASRGGSTVSPLFQPRRYPEASELGLYLLDSAARSVVEYGSDQRVRQVFRTSERPVPVTPGLIASVLAERKAAGMDTSRARLVPEPTSLPSVGRFWVNRDGWVAIDRMDQRRRAWHDADSVVVQVFGPDGQDRGSAVLPPGFVINDFSGTRLYGLRPDSSLRAPRRTVGAAPLVCNRIEIIELALLTGRE
jgi:hypothetical protein